MAWPRRDVCMTANILVPVAAGGGTLPAIGRLYRGLARPAWQPADGLFGLVRTAIVTLTAIGGVSAWRPPKAAVDRANPWGALMLNGLRKVFSGAMDFRACGPDPAAPVGAAFGLPALARLLLAPRYSPLASCFPPPCLVRFGCAGVLTAAVTRRNGQFE